MNDHQVLRNGSFLFATNITREDTYTGLVAPFLSENDPSSDSISYEVHQGNTSQHILSLVNSIIHQHENATNFNANWLLVTTWKNVHQYGSDYVRRK